MLSKGNGAPWVCVHNLMRTLRGEAPFERLKGVDSALLGKPTTALEAQIIDDLKWMISTYEPRIQLAELDIRELLTGNASLTANVKIGG